jgi:hypothetical protein
MLLINHSFRPPRKLDDRRWKVIRYLIENGFTFQHIYQTGKNDYSKTATNNYISSPKTLNDATEFVQKYKYRLTKR